jgi:hypothetical protein
MNGDWTSSRTRATVAPSGSLSMGGKFCHNKFCDVLMAALNTRLEFMTEKRGSLMYTLST